MNLIATVIAAAFDMLEAHVGAIRRSLFRTALAIAFACGAVLPAAMC